MNCKTCGGTTVAKNTSRGQAFECNQDNGDCFGNNGYPTTTWGTSLRQNGGGHQNGPRRAPAPQQQQRQQSPSPSDGGVRWGNCLTCASKLVAAWVAKENAAATINDIATETITLTRKLYAAKPATAAARPAPKPAPEPEPEPEPGEEPQVF